MAVPLRHVQSVVENETKNPGIEELTSLPPPTLADAREFVGTWKGTSLHEGGVPVDLILTLEVRGEVVVGRTNGSIRGQDFGTREHDFTRVADGGKTLEWGHLNQRGPGIEVYRVTLQEDGTLVGTMEMQCVPDGYLPEDFVSPVFHVSLESAS